MSDDDSDDADSADTGPGASGPGTTGLNDPSASGLRPRGPGRASAPANSTEPHSEQPAPRAAHPASAEAQAAAPQPAPFDELATQAMSVNEIAAAHAPMERPTEIFPMRHGQPTPPTAPTAIVATDAAGAHSASDGSPSEIDSLFGDDQFREQKQPRRIPAAQAPPSPAPSTRSVSSDGHHPMSRANRILLWSAGGLVVVLALVGLFLLGSRLGEQSSVASGNSTATPIATPTTGTGTETAVGPLAPGDYAWDRMLGRECLEPFDSVWADEFTVVACDTEHTAQLIGRGQLPEEKGSEFPGVDALAAEVNALCAAPSVLNYAAAGTMSDIQTSASFPSSDTEWTTGDRDYYCFVTRGSGEPISGDLAVAPAEEG